MRPTVTTRVTVTFGATGTRRMIKRSINAPASGARTKTEMTKARPGLRCQGTESCQYMNAMNMPMAPCAMLKMPEVA